MLQLPCSGACCCSMNRRGFLRGCGAAATVAAAASLNLRHGMAAETSSGDKVRVAAVFLSNIDVHEIWPYPGFDTAGRQKEVLTALASGCPDVIFVPVVVKKPTDVQQALSLKEDVDGYLVYVMTLDWSQVLALVTIGQLGKPTLVVDEFLGGSGAFLSGVTELRRGAYRWRQ